ncbi:MAG: hypothetical protein AAF845_16415 [Bacteroidota bacterium]
MTETLPDDGEIRFLKHRDAGSVLNAAFVFIRRNARELILGFLAIVGPVALASGIAFALYFRQFGDLFQNPEAIESMSFGAFGVSYVGAIVFSLLAGAVAQAVVGAYVRMYRLGEAGTVSVGDLWEGSKGLVLPMVGLNLLFGLVAGFSVVIVAIPCLGALAWLAFIVWLLPYYIVTMASRAVEAGTVREAWARSRALVKGSWGFAFGAFVLALVVFYIAITIVSLPMTVVMFAAVFNSATGDMSGMFTTMGALMAPLQVLSSLGYLVPLMAGYFIHGRLAEEMDGTALHDDLDALADRSAATQWTGEPLGSTPLASTPPASTPPASEDAAPGPAADSPPPADDAPPSGFRGGGFRGGA